MALGGAADGGGQSGTAAQLLIQVLAVEAWELWLLLPCILLYPSDFNTLASAAAGVVSGSYWWSGFFLPKARRALRRDRRAEQG